MDDMIGAIIAAAEQHERAAEGEYRRLADANDAQRRAAEIALVKARKSAAYLRGMARAAQEAGR